MILTAGGKHVSVTFQKRPKACLYSKWFKNSFVFISGVQERRLRSISHDFRGWCITDLATAVKIAHTEID